MKIDIKELLDFFDDKKGSQKGDASAIMAILGEDLNASIYKHYRGNKVEILPDSVLPGTNKGQRLDRWIMDNKKLYQCEIKNWAATAIGGKQLKSDADDEKINTVANYHWIRELNSSLSNKEEQPNQVSKVLLKMKPPERYKAISKIEPLLIFWMPVTSDKKGLKPLSVISVKLLNLPKIKTEFLKLNIFSVSLYLRQLYKQGKGLKFIDIEMPNFEHRMETLKKFLK